MTETCDDVYIGNILNSYHIKRNEDYRKYIKGLPHCWYKSIDTEINCNHKLSNYGNQNNSFDYLKNFITIQIKVYPLNLRNHKLELEHYKEVHDSFIKNSIDNINEIIESINEYSMNPSIFIGSIIGYIDYYNWLKISYKDLYNYQVNHKADDDPFKGKNMILY